MMKICSLPPPYSPYECAAFAFFEILINRPLPHCKCYGGHQYQRRTLAASSPSSSRISDQHPSFPAMMPEDYAHFRHAGASKTLHCTCLSSTPHAFQVSIPERIACLSGLSRVPCLSMGLMHTIVCRRPQADSKPCRSYCPAEPCL